MTPTWRIYGGESINSKLFIRQISDWLIALWVISIIYCPAFHLCRNHLSACRITIRERVRELRKMNRKVICNRFLVTHIRNTRNWMEPILSPVDPCLSCHSDSSPSSNVWAHLPPAFHDFTCDMSTKAERRKTRSDDKGNVKQIRHFGM